MTEPKQVRIDKFLWAVRIYKTRSIASDECTKGRIIIRNVQVKPSRIISRDEIIIVRKPPVTYTYRIIEPIANRLSPKLVSNYVEDLTPEDEKIKAEIKNSGFVSYRGKGTGRPTKKERRNLDRFIEDFDNS
ncbi:MAG TPA: RNA-binding S4 domain-containing protein [Bacteroidales bacterium]|jgi:ribosome-associated heat shock protein Hsp15|nr:RNA-binding S4 domain-containing protein [Bacteroidales bacterium]